MAEFLVKVLFEADTQNEVDALVYDWLDVIYETEGVGVNNFAIGEYGG